MTPMGRVDGGLSSTLGGVRVHSNEMHAAMEQVAGEYVTPITTTA